MSKKMEGNEVQRRRAAREARLAGDLPSARKATTGASKQRGTPHADAEPLVTHRGKQRELAEERDERRRTPRVPLPPPGPGRSFRGRGHPAYGPEHARVFTALEVAESRHGGEGAYAPEIARTAGLPVDRTRGILHDLAATHHLVTELQGVDRPDLGTRYESA
ncbi:hypothetical protein [Streptomyces hainanensis]|uniref:Uncharacterized protein n=1 Tax=Streptomyces hainanensis TaxID=402648 RepID=A0A4R4TBM9_9ACTN|nr:hypothetical protein [Streptomyces hainanensis]TDC72934.1 hypothetical protein E1283_20435 [Streptomyces hainanensis]